MKIKSKDYHIDMIIRILLETKNRNGLKTNALLNELNVEKKMGISKPTLIKRLNYLEENELIDRVKVKKDKRTKINKLNPMILALEMWIDSEAELLEKWIKEIKNDFKNGKDVNDILNSIHSFYHTTYHAFGQSLILKFKNEKTFHKQYVSNIFIPKYMHLIDFNFKRMGEITMKYVDKETINEWYENYAEDYLKKLDKSGLDYIFEDN